MDVVGLWTGDRWPSSHQIREAGGTTRDGSRRDVGTVCGMRGYVDERLLTKELDLSRKSCETCLRYGHAG